MEVRDLDCLYEACPIPMIKAIKELRTMNSEDILVLHSDQSCVGVIVKEWGQENNYSKAIINRGWMYEVYN